MRDGRTELMFDILTVFSALGAAIPDKPLPHRSTSAIPTNARSETSDAWCFNLPTAINVIPLSV